MGEFCLSGFHSRIPLKSRDKVVAIICKRNNDEISAVPCYLESSLIPMHIPVVGTMGDYGILEEYEEDITTELFKSNLNMDFIEISNILFEYRPGSNNYNKEYGVTDLFKKLRELEYPHNLDNTITYTLIYEHYAIYKAMTHDIHNMRKTLPTLDKQVNIFSSYALDNIPAQIMMEAYKKGRNIEDKELEKIREKYDNILTPGKYLWNYNTSLQGLNGFYYNSTINWIKYIDKLIEWCSFISTLDYMNGSFTPSMEAGQSWHYDEEYVKEHQHLHQLIACLYKRLLLEDCCD